MLPPRDYPDTIRHGLASVNDAEDPSVTVRGVLDRLDSKQPVTDAMINIAVTNLFTADAHVYADEQSRNTPPSINAQANMALPSKARVVAPRMPKVLSALFNSVRRS